MKKILTFIPLGIGISSTIVYILNVLNYKVINNTVALSQILINLKTYLYISIISFVLYFIIKLIFYITSKEKTYIENDSPTNDVVVKEVIITGNKYCYNCGERIFDTDKYCKNCGKYQVDKKSGINPVLRKIINVLEIVILILIIYFSLAMLFEYKEEHDSSFKSPFKISITK